MSTRATYEVEGETFYLHHDGYPEGAASKFEAFLSGMFVKEQASRFDRAEGKEFEWYQRRKLHHGFIAGLPRAEESEHHTHGDTEYQYRIRWVEQDRAWPTVGCDNDTPDRFDNGAEWDELKCFKIKRLHIVVKEVQYNCHHCDGDLERGFKTIFMGPLSLFMEKFRFSKDRDGKTMEWCGKIVSVWETSNTSTRHSRPEAVFKETLIPEDLLFEMLTENGGEHEPIEGHGKRIMRSDLQRAYDNEGTGWKPWHDYAIAEELATEHGHKESDQDGRWKEPHRRMRLEMSDASPNAQD